MIDISDKLKEKFTDEEVGKIIKYAQSKYDSDIAPKSKFYNNLLNGQTLITDYCKSDVKFKIGDKIIQKTYPWKELQIISMDMLNNNYQSSSRYKVANTDGIEVYTYIQRVDEEFELNKRLLRREFLEGLGI